MNIPQSAIEPFGVVGIPLFHIMKHGEAYDVYLKQRWNDLDESLTHYGEFLRTRHWRESPDTVAGWIASYAVLAGADTAKVRPTITPDETEYHVVARIDGRGRQKTIVLPMK